MLEIRNRLKWYLCQQQSSQVKNPSKNTKCRSRKCVRLDLSEIKARTSPNHISFTYIFRTFFKTTPTLPKPATTKTQALSRSSTASATPRPARAYTPCRRTSSTNASLSSPHGNKTTITLLLCRNFIAIFNGRHKTTSVLTQSPPLVTTRSTQTSRSAVAPTPPRLTRTSSPGSSSSPVHNP